jgi:hypothetical protein
VSVFKHGAGRFATSGKPTSEGRRSSGPIPLHNALSAYEARTTPDKDGYLKSLERLRHVMILFKLGYGSREMAMAFTKSRNKHSEAFTKFRDERSGL